MKYVSHKDTKRTKKSSFVFFVSSCANLPFVTA